MASDGEPAGYAPVGDVRMYYEVHGEGRPLLLLHGAYMSVDSMRPLLSGLAQTRRVIAADLRGHGRTGDVEGPITYELMADDTAGLMDHLGIDEADVVGFSMGAATALQLAIRHPERVRRLVAASVSSAYDGMHAAALEMLPTITPDVFAGTPIEAEYKRLA